MSTERMESREMSREALRQREAFDRVLQFVPDTEGLRGEVRDFYDAACDDRDRLRSALLDMRVVLDEIRGEDWVDEVAARIEAMLVTAAKALHPYDATPEQDVERAR